MGRFVVDNSVVVAWGLDEGSGYADGIMDRLAQGEGLVPDVWPLEFANVLLVAQRRGRITEAEGARFRELVLALPITVVRDTAAHIMTETLRIARQHGLSVYDASYLDLALREGAPLATLDGTLRSACQDCSVDLL